MRERVRYALGWLCFELVMLLPVRMESPVYRWLVGWAGFYAHHPSQVTHGVGASAKTVDETRNTTENKHG